MAYAVSASDPSFLPGLAAAGYTFSSFLAALLLPVGELFAYMDLMYAATLFVPKDELVLAVFNQVRVGRGE